jgi:hypothetical protein
MSAPASAVKLHRVSLRVPPLLLAVPLLGIARLLPEYGFGLWLRLAAATLVLLLPGWLVSQALGLRGAVPTLSWSTALVGGALALTFAVGGSIDLTLVLVLVAGAVALVPSLRVRATGRERSAGVQRVRGLVLLAGLALGGAIWFTVKLGGDGFFHLGRVRKLDDLGALSLHAVDEFANGGLHPGYAFPLWHGWLALVAKMAGVDPGAVVLHEPSVLVPLALLVAFELGIAVFRSTSLGLATMLGQAGMIALAPGSGGAYTVLALPGTTARQLFVPAATALFFLFVRLPSRPLAATLVVCVADLSFIHPTYALFLAIALAGFAVGRLLLARGADLRPLLGALAAYALPMALVFAWLRPIVRGTLSVNPGPKEVARGLRAYAGDLVVHSPASYHLAPSVFARTGAVAVAALVLVPFALLARNRRWSAYVLGATVLVLVLELSARVFPHFADATSLSQARRAAGFVPFACAFAGGVALLSRVPRLALPVALAAGIALQLAYPGDFGIRTPHEGPSLAAWIALFGGLAALAAGTVLSLRRRDEPERREPNGVVAVLAAALFVLPVAVHGFSHWNTAAPNDPYALSPGVVRFLRDRVPEQDVVFADLETSYRISALAPVYVVAVPPAHVANTRANHVVARRAAVLHFFAHPEDLDIPRRWHAGWLVLRRHEPVEAVERAGLKPVYEDGRYVVFRL